MQAPSGGLYAVASLRARKTSAGAGCPSRRLRPSKTAPGSMMSCSCEMSPSTLQPVSSVTCLADIDPRTRPRTSTDSALLAPSTLPLWPTDRYGTSTSPWTTPSTCSGQSPVTPPLILVPAAINEAVVPVIEPLLMGCVLAPTAHEQAR